MTNTVLPDLGKVDDRDRIRAAVSDVFTAHDLDVSRGSTLDASFRARVGERIKLVWLAYGAPVRVDVTPPERPFHLVQVPLHGRLAVTSGDAEVTSDPTTASVPDPRRFCTMRMEANCSQIIVRIEDDVLHRHLESILGRPAKTPIRFELGMPLTSGPGVGWRRALDLMVAELQRDGGMLDHPLVSAQLESLLLTGLLTTQRHNYTTALHTGTGPTPPRAVRRAVDHIEENFGLALTLERLATHTGVSARTLQRGFQEHLGCSPMDYLRDVRLKQARAALIAADPGSDMTVTEIALESGFMHLGRFSVEYRRRFGESPSQTLRS